MILAIEPFVSCHIVPARLRVGLVRYLPEAGENSKDIVNSCLTISAVGGFAIAGVFVLGADIWAPSIAFIKYEPGFIVTCLVV